MTTRGIRNNNPGNIRISDTPWHGKLIASKDPEFETFDAPVDGIRAMARILETYFDEYGLSTVTSIITRWAPPNENNTHAYIRAVCESTGFEPDAVLTPDADTLGKLVPAIIRQENGEQPYSEPIIAAGVALALHGEDETKENGQ